MAKTYIVLTPNNQVNFSTTRAVLINNAHKIASAFKNYGAGTEAAYECVGCNRELPIILFHLDHIRSQSRYAVSNLGIKGSGGFVTLNSDLDKVDAKVNATGGMVTVATGSIYNPKIGYIQSSEIWKNDLKNLQLLCPTCNESKGSKDWVDWGRALNAAKPLSKVIKGVWDALDDIFA
ncbi:MAG: HNH endonuclease [Ramlibacter sp.]|nr:HNH endonuclease [Ramlibacter sp.]MCW5649799.1 HNH endonuclease [Ramlibacter sp.]